MKKHNTILVTGGLGFIGSGICHKLLELGYNVKSIDFMKDFDSAEDAEFKLSQLAKSKGLKFRNYKDDLTKIDQVASHDYSDCTAIIHLAAYKSIAESLDRPAEFITNNVNCTSNILLLAEEYNIRRIIFSSTAAVYSPKLHTCFEPDWKTIHHDFGAEGSYTHRGDAYAASKLLCEQLLLDYASLEKEVELTIFRYFNPIGSYNHLIEDMSDSMFGNAFRAIKNKETFHIFGGDYPTHDGTCLRDYVDLRDIVDAHAHVLEHEKVDCLPIFNLGRGEETSVLQCCQALKSLVPEFKWDIIERRPGDSYAGIANCGKMHDVYGWEAKYSIEDTIKYHLCQQS